MPRGRGKGGKNRKKKEEGKMDTNVNYNLGKKRKKEKVKMETEKDLSKILIREEAVAYELEFKGEKFTFKVRELPWVQITKIASRCLDYSGKKVVIDRSEFDTQFLEMALVADTILLV